MSNMHLTTPFYRLPCEFNVCEPSCIAMIMRGLKQDTRGLKQDTTARPLWPSGQMGFGALTLQNFGKPFYCIFFIDMMVLIKIQEGVELSPWGFPRSPRWPPIWPPWLVYTQFWPWFLPYLCYCYAIWSIVIVFKHKEFILIHILKMWSTFIEKDTTHCINFAKIHGHLCHLYWHLKFQNHV